MELYVEGYEGYANPQNDMVGYIIDTCHKFSYKFNNGVYFLTGEIDSGAWAFVYSLLEAPNNNWASYKDIILNGKSTNLSEIKKLSFNVGQYEIYKEKTFGSVLRQTLKKSESNYTTDELVEKFNLEFRFLDMKMSALNLRRWACSPAIGLALNKKIFAFPWLGKKHFLNDVFLGVFHTLSKEDVIVLVPCSEKIKIPEEDNFNVVRMSSLYEFDYENIER